MEYEDCPSDSELIETHFIDGPLGVTLRRRLEDGIVFVYDIIPNSQAISLDVQPNDELWAVGDSILGTIPLDKQAWKGLIEFIKACPRPLKLIWRRKFTVAEAMITPRSEDNYSKLSFEIPTSNNVVNITASNSNSNNDLSNSNENTSTDKNYQNSPKAVDFISTEKIISDSDDDIGIGGTEVVDNDVENDIKENNLNKLRELSELLYYKEKEKSSIVTSFMKTVVGSLDTKEIETVNLVKDGRTFIRMSDLDVNIQKSTNKITFNNINVSRKTVILLSDILIIATPMPNNLFQIEETVNLQIVKIKNYLITPIEVPNEQSILEIITPNNNIILYYLNIEIKNIWFNEFIKIIKLNNILHQEMFGWIHQYILGSLHSAVILRDIPLVEEILNGFDLGLLNYTLIDEIDEDGYTPLHYACILRLQNLVKILVDASANVDIPDKHGLTSIHWAAMNLDYEALTLLTPRTCDVNLRDYDDRTPLFLALIEGKDSKNSSNIQSIIKCSEVLLKCYADSNVCDHDGQTLLHYLAASWQVDLIELLLQYQVEIVTLDYSYYMPALHYACQGVSLRHKIGGSSRILNKKSDNETEDITIYREYAIATLRILLQAGSRPNFKSRNNKTPLNLIVDNEYIWGEMLPGAIKTLVSYGARIDLTDVVLNQYIKNRLNENEINGIIEWRSQLPPVDADSVNISTFEASKDQVAMQFIHESPNNSKNKVIPMCLLCSAVFSLFKRQHHCRLCNVLCCDDCSKRRVIVNSNPVRSCDPCYNRVQYFTEKKSKKDNSKNKSEDKTINKISIDKNKSDLFGSSNTNNSSNNTRSQPTTINSNESTIAQLSETKDRLLERGEKLNKLSDKSMEMSNQANEFAKLAKQLNDQQKNSWFNI